MHTSYWKMGIATILATGILASGATAQDGASGDVTIKDKAPVVTAPSDTSPANTKPVKPMIVERDPFVNQMFSSDIPRYYPDPNRRNPVPIKPIDTQTKEPLARPDADPIASETEVPVEIPAPDVTVNGIVSSPSGSSAIISTSVGTRMISAGEKLGDYRVSSIGADYVSFSYGQTKVFKVSMASEF